MSDVNITYKNNDSAEGFDLGLIGESYIGTNSIMKELAALTGIKGEIEIRTTKITHSSIDLHNAVYITLTGLPFATPQELYDFLQVASPEMYREAREYFSGALGVRKDLNTY